MMYFGIPVIVISALFFGPGLLNWIIKRATMVIRRSLLQQDICSLFSREIDVDAEVAFECWQEIAMVTGFPWSKLRPGDRLDILCSGFVYDVFDTAECGLEIVSVVERRSGPIGNGCFPQTVSEAVCIMARKGSGLGPANVTKQH